MVDLKDYTELGFTLRNDRTAFLIYTILKSGKDYRFNELYQLTLEAKEDREPEKKSKLSKTTFSNSLKLLVKNGALLYKDEEDSNLRIKPRRYWFNPEYAKWVNNLTEDYNNSIQSEIGKWVKILNKFEPHETAVIIGVVAQIRLFEALKSALETPDLSESRFWAISRDFEFLGRELSKVAQRNSNSTEYIKALDKYDDLVGGLFRVEYKKIAEKFERLNKETTV